MKVAQSRIGEVSGIHPQLLGAKLNIANGADNSAVAGTIANADDFLASNDSTAWSSLTWMMKQTVLSWMTTLDNFNNGSIGPGHCP